MTTCQARDRPLPDISVARLLAGGRAGGRRADAAERDRARPGAAGISLRRPARDRQDVDGQDPREGIERRGRAERRLRSDDADRAGDRRRDRSRRRRDGRGLAARHRRDPRDPRARDAPAGRGPLQGLHPRRGAPAHVAGMERPPEADRGAAAAPRLRLLHDRPLEGDPDGPLALPDVRLPAAPAAGDRHRPAQRLRGRGDRRTRLGPLADRTGCRRLVPRRDLDARPAVRRDGEEDHRPGRPPARHGGRGGHAVPALRHDRRSRRRGRPRA